MPSDLTRQCVAAVAVKRSRTALHNAIKRGAVRKYLRHGVPLVSLADVRRWALTAKKRKGKT